MNLTIEELCKLLWDRVTYINNIRMAMFRFHLVVSGTLTALLIHKIDFEKTPLIPTNGLPIIGWISLGICIVGLSIFVFDVWVLAHLKATTSEIAYLFTNNRPALRPKGKPWYGFDEDFWVVVPMMFINSSLFGAAIYVVASATKYPYALCIISAFLLLIIQIIANRVLPFKLAPNLGALPDGYKIYSNLKKQDNV